MKWSHATLCLLLLSAAMHCSQEEDAIEMHDDVPNPPQTEEGFEGLTEEQKKQFYEMQRVRTIGCILYTQIYFNTYGQSLQPLFEAYSKDQQIKLFDKLVGGLIVHCMQNAQDEDVIKILNRAKEGDFTISDLIHLNTIEFSTLQIPSDDVIQLTKDEEGAVKAYKDYEKLAQEERKKQEKGTLPITSQN